MKRFAMFVLSILWVACSRTSGNSGSGDDTDPPDQSPPPTTGDPVLDLGHAYPVSQVFRDGDRMLTSDPSHWVLWDVAARRIIAARDQGFGGIGLAGGVMYSFTPDSAGTNGTVEVRAIDTGAVIGTIPAGSYSYTGLAVDGSYVWFAGPAGLQVWRPTGDKLLEVSANYNHAPIFAATGELRVLHGGVLEKWQISSGSVEQVPYPAQDAASVKWFQGGDRFLVYDFDSVSPGTAAVYSLAGQVLTPATTLPALTNIVGQDDFVWTVQPDLLQIYSAGDLTTALASFPLAQQTPIAARGAIALCGDDLEIVHLGATISRSAAIPVPCTAFAGDESAWGVGADDGRVFESATAIDPATRRSLTFGAPYAIAGAANGTAAISTAASLLIVRPAPGGSQILHAYPPIQTAASYLAVDARLKFSADGSALVYNDASAIHVLNIADGTERFSRPGHDFALAPNLLATMGDDGVAYMDLDGNPVPAHGPANADRLAFSPDGKHLAASVQVDHPLTEGPYILWTYDTQLFEGTSKIAEFPGESLGWIDNGRQYIAQVIKYAVDAEALTLEIRDPSGTVISSAPTSQQISPDVLASLIQMITPIAGDRVYLGTNAELDVISGEQLWWRRTDEPGALVGGNRVLSAVGSHVYLDSVP